MLKLSLLCKSFTRSVFVLNAFSDFIHCQKDWDCRKDLRSYYTMRSLTGDFISPPVFHFTSCFTSRFSSRFRYQHVGISKTQVKTQERCKENARKIQNASPTPEKCKYYYTMRWTKMQVSCVLVAFWSLFGRFLVAFWSRFGRVLVAFWSRFGRVLVINLTKTQTQRIV